jgi:hypothetical protein
MICLLPVFSESNYESRFGSLSLISTTNDCFERHSSVLCQGILWNLHHFPVSFFVFPRPFFSCVLDWFSGDCLFGPSLSYFGCCGFADLNSRLFWCLNFCSILIAYRYATPSDEMSRKSISVWMYLCRAPRYFKTKCHSESLIPSLVCKVWKVLVNSETAWPLSCRSVVHLMYWSS